MRVLIKRVLIAIVARYETSCVDVQIWYCHKRKLFQVFSGTIQRRRHRHRDSSFYWTFHFIFFNFINSSVESFGGDSVIERIVTLASSNVFLFFSFFLMLLFQNRRRPFQAIKKAGD